MALNSMQEIFEKAASRSIPFWRVVLETDMEERQVSREESFGKMQQMYAAMRASDAAYDRKRKSASGPLVCSPALTTDQ